MTAMQEIKKIFIVPYCHADWVWTLTRRWHEKRYVLVFEDVLDLLKEHPEFRWYMDTYITQLEPFLRARPERCDELRMRVAGGQIGICGTFSNIRPNMVGQETLVRDITIGRGKYRERFPEADLSVYAGIVDVSVGHPQMPQVLALSGYKYLRFWRPHAALSAKKVPLEFFWQGCDGSRILCSRGPYDGLNSRANLLQELHGQLRDDRELSPTGVVWVTQGGDDCRPLRSVGRDEMIPIFDLIQRWNATEKAPLAFATPQEFFAELETRTDDIPTVPGPLDPCDVSYNVGWGGSSGLFALRQANEIDLTECEKWAAIASGLGCTYRETEIAALWEDQLLTCAHATQWAFEEDFEDIYRRAQYVKLRSRQIKADALDFLKGMIGSTGDSEVVLFNSLPFAREEKVSMKVCLAAPVDRFGLRDGRNKAVPFQVIDRNEKSGEVWEHRLVAKVRLPASGYSTISVVKGKTRAKSAKIPFGVRFSGSDVVEIIHDSTHYKTTRRNPFGGLTLYKVDTTKGQLHVGPIRGSQAVRWHSTRVEEDGELYCRYRSTGQIGRHEIVRDVVVHKDEPRVEFHIGLTWVKEDGFLTLEWPRGTADDIYADFPFGGEVKDMDGELFGSWSEAGIERQRKDLFVARSFVSGCDGAKSISYFNHDATHYYILFERSMGNILMNACTHRPGWERFENHRLMGQGQHRFVSHMLFHSGDWRRANLPRKSESLFRPPEPVFVDKMSNGPLPSFHSFGSVSPANLIVTALYRQGRSLILRFYEAAGRRTKARIRLPFAPARIKKIDLQGRVLSPLPADKDVSLQVAPREIVTLRLA